MTKIGAIVLVNTGEGHKVPAIITSKVNDEGKHWATVFPGPNKDTESLQGPANELQIGPGTGKYESEEL